MDKTHPVQAKYAKRVGAHEAIYLHAEISALVRCRHKPHAIYIARVLRNGDVGYAKPCPICELAIKEAGIREVHYTI
jgi:deoxycytidylate deaminase